MRGRIGAAVGDRIRRRGRFVNVCRIRGQVNGKKEKKKGRGCISSITYLWRIAHGIYGYVSGDGLWQRAPCRNFDSNAAPEEETIGLPGAVRPYQIYHPTSQLPLWSLNRLSKTLCRSAAVPHASPCSALPSWILLLVSPTSTL